MTIAIILTLVFTAMSVPAFFCAGFYYGFSTAEGVFCQKAVTTENIPGKKFLDNIGDKIHTETEQERLSRILAENVENFGTNVPQKEVV